MIDQRLKDIYYATFVKLSVISFWWVRLTGKNKYRNAWVHLCCGKNYISGMVNVDGNIFQKKDLWFDITSGLPFESGSLAGIYTSHALEHFNYSRAQKIISELYRALKPGGVLRIVVPSLEYALKAYTENNHAAFCDWPRKFDSIGGRFTNFLLCDNQHRLIFDYTLMEEMLVKAGFREIKRLKNHVSDNFSQQQMSFESSLALDEASLYVECLK